MSTGLLRQYNDLKSQHPDAILFFRVGEFYETFGPDAQLASRVLDITLTQRDGEPLAGVPVKSAPGYLRKMTDKGYRVALAEQLVDPKTVRRGLVPRGVVEILTPACHPDSALDTPVRHCFLTAIYPYSGRLATASVDITTSDIRLEWTTAEEWPDFAASLGVKEILLPKGVELSLSLPTYQVAVPPPAEGPGPEPLRTAMAMAISYLREVQPASVEALTAPVLVESRTHLLMDMGTRRALEIIHSPSLSLAEQLDRTQTASGARLLTDWLSRPLASLDAIAARHTAVEAFLDHTLRTNFQTALTVVRDIERIAVRAVTGTLTAREMAALRSSLSALPQVNGIIEPVHTHLTPFIQTPTGLETHTALSNLLSDALCEAPAITLGEGEVIRQGYDKELDDLRALHSSAEQLLADIQTRQRARTSIPSLKVGHTGPFGHYIEVTRPHLAKVPSDYRRRQSLTNAERFTTDELDTLASQLASASAAAQRREAEIFATLRLAIAQEKQGLKHTAQSLAQLDVLASYADVAVHAEYVRPLMTDTPLIQCTELRHPIVEAGMSHHAFVPNDLCLDTTRTLLVTGPNMGGKSTYLRSAALAVVLSHAGSFVPATEATIGVADRLAVRVGASDNLARGQSTFMLEMLETAAIVKDSTSRSLVVLDEVGRGTATKDGLAIAQAVLETLASRGCRTLFATHFHELQDVADTLPHTENVTMAVEEHEGSIYFLHHVRPGRADQSYGLHVAQLAGMPQPVLDRAKELMSRPSSPCNSLSTSMVPTKTPTKSPVLDLLETANLWDLSPVAALDLLSRAQNLIRNS